MYTHTQKIKEKKNPKVDDNNFTTWIHTNVRRVSGVQVLGNKNEFLSFEKFQLASYIVGNSFCCGKIL